MQAASKRWRTMEAYKITCRRTAKNANSPLFLSFDFIVLIYIYRKWYQRLTADIKQTALGKLICYLSGWQPFKHQDGNQPFSFDAAAEAVNFYICIKAELARQIEMTSRVSALLILSVILPGLFVSAREEVAN